ncbi:MAG: hybrid sensor histidine kinase/response regulator [Acidocella sp.]|nr:hybrid sensor histidine kinase/response regulator [Acidocella sp.]
MSKSQHVIHQRRQYNQWVGNQTVEDFALRFTAGKARRWSAFRVGNTALGGVAFLACEAIGGTITIAFGFANAMAAIAAVGVLMFFIGLPICLSATRNGVDVDLLTRGAGFGYIGSTITSLIYATFTFILFSIEASIMSGAITMVLPIPLWVANIIAALIVIPIAAYGIRAISHMQVLTQPVWLVLQFGPLAYLAWHGLPEFSEWTHYAGHMAPEGFSLLPFGMAASVLLSLIPQIGEQVDYLRFLPERQHTAGAAWWASLLLAGPGWVIIGCAKLAAGSFLTYLALSQGVALANAAQPATMYRLAFFDVFHNPTLAAWVMLVFIVTCQIKINSTNAYAGSIAWSNFFSRLTHSHPGRVVWVVFNVLLALLLMEIGIFRIIQNILGLYANLAVGWMGALVADLVINKPLGLSPKGIEFKRAHLYDINPVGVGAMAMSVLVSSAMSFNLLGPACHALAPFWGLAIAFLAAPSIAFATKGKYYLARTPGLPVHHAAERQCIVCESHFEAPDMAHCPAYAGNICSLCCSLDARCHDMCKPSGRVSDQLTRLFTALLPPSVTARINRRVGIFFGVFFLFVAIESIILALTGYEYALIEPHSANIIHTTLWAVFFVTLILTAIAAWLLVLAQASRRAAEQETSYQTERLFDEIAAHERTDAALEKAKAAAESANTAKSRYIVGVIHEIRAPLNAIFGYAQLLEHTSTLRPADAVRVIRRSAEHLSNLVDGLLDISQIETGSLHLHRDRVDLPAFLDQIVDMFRLQALSKGIEFREERPQNLPDYVFTDEKRLRQILINLLSNAIKYTERGSATLRTRLSGQVTEFSIIDTGLGIHHQDLETIFEPFERGHTRAANAIPGTGLGLTISKLLTQILGGEITVSSTLGQGSIFRVRLLLSAAPANAAGIFRLPRVTGYSGERQKILIADDDPDHVELLHEILLPLGFIVLSAHDGETCLTIAENTSPHLVILDISMPGISGLDIAAKLRTRFGAGIRILIVSGNFHDAKRIRHDGDIATSTAAHDDFLAKPIDIRAFLEKIRLLLRLNWIHETKMELQLPLDPPPAMRHPARPHLEDLLQLGRIGYIKGIEAKLTEISETEPDNAAFAAHLRDMVRRFELAGYMSFLENLVKSPS